MSADNLISVIIPVYNTQQYLKQCIDSVINQTYKNLEIILVDDGSTDDSPKICDEYTLKDNRIKVIHKQNGGVSSARNAGLKIAKGDYIGFVDSDDFIAPDMYETLCRELISTNTDLVICNWYIECDKWIENTVFPKEKVLTIQEAVKYLYRSSSVCTRLFKKNTIENIFFNEKIGFGEDRLFYLEVYNKINKISCCPSAKYYYRKNLNSTTNANEIKENFIPFIDVLDLEINYAKQNNLIDLAKRLYSIQLSCSTRWLGLIALTKYPNIESKKYLLKFVRKNLFNFLKTDAKLSKKCFIIIACINFNLASKIYRLIVKQKEIK